MTTPAVLPHRDAVRAALEAAQLVVGLGGAPDPVPSSGMYVVLYFTPGQSLPESLADARTDFDSLFQVTCVGPDEERCLWLADKVRTALYGPLTVAGRVVWRPEELGGPPVQRDDDVSPPLFYVPVQYRLQSTS
ncbi:hypothetical protein F7R91_14730 [Streptomyces luteolifulvus]|uniref:Uncharacterized protein n=1 Tax=Streptomyces luteolifulvus TaxID=2615112 RepID=A0A6H9V1G6_9ACTN|nr:hypothetical protein [Streptomyces luteolifulvus]KAB1146829.1 hypothetical protein F7R91_14730 [Streptomyces luteolifulvus]